jgi:hypothetical protein
LTNGITLKKVGQQFEGALTDAQAVLDNEEATQAEVDNALVALEAAIEGLAARAILKAPDGPKELAIPSLTTENVLYLAFGLTNEAGSQVASSLTEVKEFIDEEYGVNFNADAIKVIDGKLSITGSILSQEDWRKVKDTEEGDLTRPYRITVLISDKSNKVAKIAMYEDGNAVIEDLQEPVVPETASFVAKNSFGINDNKVYAGYELQDETGNQIPLIENNIESITVLEPDAAEPKTLTVVGNEDPLLWFNIAKKAGTYTYTVVTKGEDAKTYEATIDWNEPTEATVSFQAPAGAEAVFTAASEDAPAQVDFSKVTANKLLDWTSVKTGYYAIELKIESVDLREENVKYAFRVYGDGTAIEPEIKGDLDCQYVTTDWELGTATMYYVLADGSLYQAKINVVSLTSAEEPAPDTTDPELVGVSPEAGDIQLGYGETFKLEVTASDENLYELEVDHSFEGTLPEFSVYASEDDPYGGQEAAFKAQGVEVTYDADAQKWTIDFGEAVTEKIVEEGGITFYLVIKDEAGNQWGSMYDVTDENTFKYTVTQAAPLVSTYEFEYTLPGKVIAGEEYTVPVTIEPETVGDFGYDSVRFNVEVTTPDGATLQLLATDDTGTYDVAQIGYWGPPTGFPISADYSATTEFTAIFSDAGDYTIIFSLVDLSGEEPVAIITETVEVTVEETVEETITLAPATGEATVIQGAELEASAVTLSSNYNATGLKTFISLKKGDTPVNFDAVFEEFNLATKVGDGEVDGPYNMVCADSSFQYGPSSGFAVEAGVPQVTTTTGTIKADAPVGTYVITTKVRAGEEVLATAIYTLVVEEAVETSLTMSAADVDAITGEEFTMAVTAKGIVADADKDNKVRFYGVIPGLSAADIDLAEIEGGKPEIVTDETERGYAGAGTDDLVLAWGPAGGFPLKEHDYSEGVTTEFKATIKKAGEYTVIFVFYDITGGKQLNAKDETATITIKPTLAATISMVDPSEDVIGTVGWTRFAGSVEVAEGVKDTKAYYIFEIEGENGLVEETVPQYWDYQAESWKDFAVEDGKYRFGGKDGFPLTKELPYEGQTEFQVKIDGESITGKAYLVDADNPDEIISNVVEATITAEPTLAATISMVDPSEDVIGTVGWTRFAGSVEVAEDVDVEGIKAYYIFEIEGDLATGTVPQYYHYETEEWLNFADLGEGKYSFGPSSGFDLSTVDGAKTEFQANIQGDSVTGKAYLVDADTGAVISNIVEETIEADSAAVSIEDEEGTNVQMMQVPVIEEDCVEGEETSKEMGTETEVTTEDPAENGAEAIVDEEVEDGIDEKQLIEEEEIKTEVEDKEDVAEEEDAA